MVENVDFWSMAIDFTTQMKYNKYNKLVLLICILGVLFLIMALKDSDDNGSINKDGILPSESGLVTEMVLLSEEDTELCICDIYGKTAVVIGRNVKENQVDIDLNASPYASMVDIEYAVMNLSSRNWYIYQFPVMAYFSAFIAVFFTSCFLYVTEYFEKRCKNFCCETE